MIDYHNPDHYEAVVVETEDIDWHEACINPGKWNLKKTVRHSYYLRRKSWDEIVEADKARHNDGL